MIKKRQRANRISPVSKSRSAKLAEYNRLKIIWRAEPRNFFCRKCGKPADKSPHHVYGRLLALCETRTWLALCLGCHDWTHANPVAARMIGLLAPFGKWNTNPYK